MSQMGGDGKPDRQSQTQSIILDEKYDESYEPSDAEIAEYADFLGLDVESEPHLVWVARAGLKAPLPKEWKPCQTDDGQVYYFNFQTGESVWTHPCDDHFLKMYQDARKKNPIPPRGWSPGDDDHLEAEAIRFFEPSTEIKEEAAPDDDEQLSDDADADEIANDDDERHQVEEQGLKQEVKQERTALATNSGSRSPSRSAQSLPRADSSTESLPQSQQRSKGLRFEESSMADTVSARVSRKSSITSIQPVAVVPAVVSNSDDRVTLLKNSAVNRLASGSSPLAKSMSSMTSAAGSSAAVRLAPALTSRKSSSATQRPALDFSVFELDETLLKNDPSALTKNRVQQQSELMAAEAQKQKELMARMLTGKLDGMRKEMEEHEREERLAHDAQLANMRQTFSSQRDQFEQTERARLEKFYISRAAELDANYRERLRAEEKRVADELDRARTQLRAETDAKLAQEEQRARQDYENRLTLFKREMEAKYAGALSEEPYKLSAEQKRAQYGQQLDTELAAIRDDFNERKRQLVRNHDEAERDERRRLDTNIAEVRAEWQRRKSEEDAQGEKELAAVKLKWRHQFELVNSESEAKEKQALLQKSEAYQERLREKQKELQRQHEIVVIEWQTKITNTKAALSQELQSLEAKLAVARDKNSQEHEHEIVTSFVSGRDKINSALKENDKLFELQRRRRDFLDNESRTLDKMEAKINEQRLRIAAETERNMLRSTSASPERPDIRRRASVSPGRRSAAVQSRHSERQSAASDDEEVTERPARHARITRENKTINENYPPPKPSAQKDRTAARFAFQPISAPRYVFEDFEDDVDYDEESEADPLPSSSRAASLPPEIEQPFVQESQEMGKTKKRLKAQRGSILARQQQLDETRKRWQQELDEISARLQTTALSPQLAPAVSSSAVPNSMHGTRQSERMETYTEHPLAREPTYRASPSTRSSARHYTPRQPTSQRRMMQSMDMVSPEPASVINGWMADQNRNEDVLRSHGLWLHKFRKRVGLRRSTTAANTRTTRT